MVSSLELEVSWFLFIVGLSSVSFLFVCQMDTACNQFMGFLGTNLYKQSRPSE